MTGAVRPVAGGVRIDLKVVPRSPRTIVDGVRGERLVVRVTSAPVDNAANDAVIDLLARTLDVPKRSLRIVAGATSRQKTVEISGLDASTALARLGR